jgi:hypothetical protein
MLKSSFASVVSDRSALLSIQRFDHKSDFSEDEEIPTILNWSDVSISGEIGQGGFSCVFRVFIGVSEDKEDAAGNSRRASTASTQEYALKRLDLKKSRTEDKRVFSPTFVTKISSNYKASVQKHFRKPCRASRPSDSGPFSSSREIVLCSLTMTSGREDVEAQTSVGTRSIKEYKSMHSRHYFTV